MPTKHAAVNSLIYLRPLTLAYVRHEGSLADCLSHAWQDLRDRIASFPLSLEGPLISYGLLHEPLDEPATTSIRYDACIEVPSGLEGAVRGKLAIQLFNGGVFIKGPNRRRHSELANAFRQLKSDPLVTHGLAFEKERPAVITYTRPPANPAWHLALNVPVGWAADALTRAA